MDVCLSVASCLLLTHLALERQALESSAAVSTDAGPGGVVTVCVCVPQMEDGG